MKPTPNQINQIKKLSSLKDGEEFIICIYENNPKSFSIIKLDEFNMIYSSVRHSKDEKIFHCVGEKAERIPLGRLKEILISKFPGKHSDIIKFTTKQDHEKVLFDSEISMYYRNIGRKDMIDKIESLLGKEIKKSKIDLIDWNGNKTKISFKDFEEKVKLVQQMY